MILLNRCLGCIQWLRNVTSKTHGQHRILHFTWLCKLPRNSMMDSQFWPSALVPMFSTNLGLSVQPALTSILRPPYPFTLVGMMSLQCNVLPCPMMHWSLVKNNGVPKSVIVLGCKRLHKLNGPENRWLPRRALSVYHCMRRILYSRWLMYRTVPCNFGHCIRYRLNHRIQPPLANIQALSHSLNHQWITGQPQTSGTIRLYRTTILLMNGLRWIVPITLLLA